MKGCILLAVALIADGLGGVVGWICRKDGTAVSDGTEQILNYIIFRPYYVETPEEVTEIATFLK